MAPGTIYYAAFYFKYKTPIPICREPTNKALKRLQIELQVNTSSVKLDLGGGNHSYLVLVLIDKEYTIISNIMPFIAPTYSPPLTIPTTATLIQALELKDKYIE